MATLAQRQRPHCEPAWGGLVSAGPSDEGRATHLASDSMVGRGGEVAGIAELPVELSQSFRHFMQACGLSCSHCQASRGVNQHQRPRDRDGPSWATGTRGVIISCAHRVHSASAHTCTMCTPRGICCRRGGSCAWNPWSIPHLCRRQPCCERAILGCGDASRGLPHSSSGQRAGVMRPPLPVQQPGLGRERSRR
jgi:hypothetical protein